MEAHLEGIQWNGANTTMVEAFVGRRCAASSYFLRIPTADRSRRRLRGRIRADELVLPLHGWVIRTDAGWRVFPPSSTDVLTELVVGPNIDAA